MRVHSFLIVVSPTRRYTWIILWARDRVEVPQRGNLIGTTSMMAEQPTFTTAAPPVPQLKCACGRSFLHTSQRGRLIRSFARSLRALMSCRNVGPQLSSQLSDVVLSSAHADPAGSSTATGNAVAGQLVGGKRKKDGELKRSGLKEGQRRTPYCVMSLSWRSETLPERACGRRAPVARAGTRMRRVKEM